MIKYTFREPLTIQNGKKADPQKIGEALEKIGGIDGEVRPEAVVEAARPRRHVLHPFFEWRDDVAAEAYRLDQARRIVRCIRVVDEDDAAPRMAYVSITDSSQGRRYVPTSTLIDNVQLQLEVLRQAEVDLRAWERRYRELSDICDLVRIARERLQDRRRDLGGDDDRPSAH